MNRRELLAAGVASVSAVLLAPPAARGYPDRAVKLVVPFSPGGATDVVGRVWAQMMKPVLATVVTESRGGGGGMTGAAEVARAQPDGHTFLFGNTSTQHSRDHAEPALRSAQGFHRHLLSVQCADLDRGARI